MKKLITLILGCFLAGSISYAANLTVAGNFPDANWDNGHTDYKMTEIGETGVYHLAKTLPAGDYEYKVFNSGTWEGPSDDRNRLFTLTEETEVNFYAKSISQFISDAQTLYMIGAASGGWGDGDRKQMDKTATGATYTFTTTSENVDFKIINLSFDNGIVWDDITPNNITINDIGNCTVTYTYETFGVHIQRNVERVFDSFVFIGSDPNNATFYNCSATAQDKTSFDGANLGARKSLYFGGEVKTNPIITEGMSVKIYYQIDDMGINEIDIPWNKNDNGNSVWKNTDGINILSGHSLTDFQEYDLNVWFAAHTGIVTVYDSNNSNNYVASFTYDSNLTGLESIKSNYNISIKDEYIHINSNAKMKIELYSISGQLISKEAAQNHFTQKVRQGIYIIRINDSIRKIIVP